MKFRLIAVAAAAFVVAAGAASAQDVTSDKGKLSYALGFKTGADAAELTDRGEQLDVNSMIKGLQDANAKAEWEKASSHNKAKSDAYIASNKAKAGVKVLPSGVQYRVMENGTGAK